MLNLLLLEAKSQIMGEIEEVGVHTGKKERMRERVRKGGVKGGVNLGLSCCFHN